MIDTADIVDIVVLLFVGIGDIEVANIHLDIVDSVDIVDIADDKVLMLLCAVCWGGRLHQTLPSLLNLYICIFLDPPLLYIFLCF